VAFVSLLKVSVIALFTGNATGVLSIVVYQYENEGSNCCDLQCRYHMLWCITD